MKGEGTRRARAIGRCRAVVRAVLAGVMLAAAVSSSADDGSSGAAGSATSSYSLRDVEDRLINGAVDFVVKRAQQEAALFFQGELADKLCPSGRALLPATCALLSSLEDSSLALTAVADQVRVTARREFRELPDRIAARLLDRHEALIEEAIKTKCRNQHVNNQDKQASCRAGTRESIANGLRAAGRALAVVRIGAWMQRESREWRSVSDIVSGMTTGLPPSVCGDGDRFKVKDFWEGCNAAETEFKAAVTQCMAAGKPCEKGGRLFDEIVDLRRQAAETDDPAKLRQLLAREKQVRRGAMRYLVLKAASESGHRELAPLVEEFLPLFEAIVAEEPSAIVAESLRAARTIIGKIGDPAVEGEVQGVESESLVYLAALGEIVRARNAKEVAETIERVASPVGSYREKLKRRMYSVTAFLGYTWGDESLAGSDSAYRRFSSPFVPIGIHGTLPFSRCLGASPCAIGAYVSLFDVGVLAAKRTNNADGTKESKVGLEQVFAPGIYATWNPGKAPIVVGAGFSRTPDLVRAADGRELASTRRSVFVAMDLTLFGF